MRHLGDFEREEAQFTTVRLEDYKGQASCFSIDIAAEEGVPCPPTAVPWAPPAAPAGLPFVAQLKRAELSTEISRLKVEAVRLHKSHSQQEGMALLKAAKRLELRLAALDFGLEERWLLDFASLERERVELTVLANVEAALRRVKRNSAADKVAALRQARQLEDREDADQVGTLARTLSWELEQLERELEPQCANTLDSCDT